MADLGCRGGEVIPTDEDDYTPSSALLKCKCGKRGWSTKNIGYIEARNIFASERPFLDCEWMKEHITRTPECKCPPSDLSVDEELIGHVKNCEVCRSYGY